MVREDVQVVPHLGEAADDARELLDRAVHAAQRAEGESVRGAEGVGDHIVVEEVHVDRGDPAIEIGGDEQREELARPDGDADIERERLDRAAKLRAPGGQGDDAPSHRAGERHEGEPHALERHPADQQEGERGPTETRAGTGEALETRVGPQTFGRSAGEDAAVAGAVLEDARVTVGDPSLHPVGHHALRKMQLEALALVVVVKARDVRSHAVHDRRLEGGRGRGQPDRELAARELSGHEQPPRIAHAAAGERAIEDPAGEAIDLNDQEAAARLDAGGRREPHPPAPAVDPGLQTEEQ